MVTTLLRVFAAQFFALFYAASSLSQEIQITLAHPYPAGHPTAQSAERFAELVREYFGDNIDIEVYPEGELVSYNNALDALRFGSIDISVLDTLQLQTIESNFGVYNIPFVFPGTDAVEIFQESTEGQQLLDALEDNNLVGITYWPGDPRVLVFARELPDVEDLLGVQLRVTSRAAPVFEALGASVLPIPFAETYTALQAGAIDAAELPLGAATFFGFENLARSVVASGHEYEVYVLSANLDFWDSLPEDISERLDEIAAQVAQETEAALAVRNQMILEDLAERGIETIAPSEETLQKWQSGAEELWPTDISQIIDPEILEAARRAGGTGGGGDPCPIGTCRDWDRKCKRDCPG